MNLIDFILNLAGLLLWLNWRSTRLDPLTYAVPSTLVGTLRRAEPRRTRRWHLLGGLALLLALRAVFYDQIGSAVNWTPKLDLAFINLAFRADLLGHQLLFSTMSFLRALFVFMFWLLILSIINRGSNNPEPIQKLIHFQLGPMAKWPWWVQAVLPVVAVAIAWACFHPLLARAEIMNWAESKMKLAMQGLTLGAGLYLSLKYLLPAMLFLHLVCSYVYLGSSPFWDFISNTSRRLLWPLNFLPLRIGRVDFAPIVGIALVILLLDTLPAFIWSRE